MWAAVYYLRSACEPFSATFQGIKKMKAACQLAARVLQHAGTLVKVRQVETPYL